MAVPLYNLSPVLSILAFGLLLAIVPVLWVLQRQRTGVPGARLRALTVLTLFLTMDLVLFGAFTRLSDSGLGCPDWPGCYGEASPLAAHAPISAAQAAMPSGPVTVSKAWVEMGHRYLATGVGALITLLMVASWLGFKHDKGPRSLGRWLPTVTFVWVCVQGAFGALTVTMKLFPAIVSLHLLGAYGLLALLTLQAVRAGAGRLPANGTSGSRLPPPSTDARVPSPAGRAHGLPTVWIAAALALLVLQAASGAWVSTNYAVLACSEFPMCQGQWWPAMDFARGFVLWRPLGENADGTVLSFQAMTAIHVAHRLLAMFTVCVLAALAWRLHAHTSVQLQARWLGGLVLLQLATGLSNVVLGWPMFAAILHTGGAAALVAVLVWLLAAQQKE
ncbi:heme A synthase [Rhodoferax lacus]|uniref:Heme A synthase n=1 Tax=Rhodoferax lacus TaxID=2184758 RepID=A0A3E1RFZ3_9BURK|nr:COX15/CtaA family protein [Rhodoferax lacus]RFO98295.1 heme A synthase [Rhodoferax lacus]